MGKMKRTALLVILLLIVASSSFALTRAFKTKEEYSHFHQSQLFLQRQSDITKCLNARNLNNVINKDENLVLNDECLIEFSRRLACRFGRHTDKTVVQKNGSETVRLIPDSLMEELCEYYFNKKPSKPLSKYYDYQKYGYVSNIAVTGIVAEIDNGRRIARQGGLDILPCVMERILQRDAHAFLLQPRHQFVQ